VKNKTCCFCKKTVLGVFGQDDLLDTYYLKNSPEDNQVLSAKIYGSCHIKCLLESPWKEFWATRRLDNLVTVRGYQLVYKDEQSEIYRNIRTKDNAILPVKGVLLSISDQRLESGLDVGDLSVKVRQPELFWEMPSSESNLKADSFFNEVGEMSLPELANHFGVGDRFYDERRAYHGKLLSITKKTDDWLKKRVLLGDVLCSTSLTSDVIAFLTKMLEDTQAEV
jgi:hypothetical protein